MSGIAFERSVPELRRQDERFMRMALALGDRNLGMTWPNPSVGSLVVLYGPSGPVIVGQGVTERGGRPHGEAAALAMAGEAARGATLYVTLEPCSTRSRADDGPSCTDRIVAQGVGRVVLGAPDPSPHAGGAGPAHLREAGIAIVPDVLAAEAARSHRGHILRVTRGRPAVTLKLARTADGFAARRGGGRLAITGAAFNARTHLLRAHHDAILVGIGTVLADDPLLTVRLPGLDHRSPVRVILDSGLRTPPGSRVVTTARKIPTWIVAAEDAPVTAERVLVAAGAEVMRVSAVGGRLDMNEALWLLGARGVTRVFCEGGPGLGDALAAADLVETVIVATAGAPLGEDGLAAVGASLSRALADRFKLESAEVLGADRVECFERLG